MSLITAVITVSTVHPGPAGGAIFTGCDASGQWLRVVAERRHIFRLPLKGELWQLTGRLIRHQLYGDQFHVENSTLLEPNGRSLVRYLCSHPAFRHIGVGQAKVARLYKTFGPQLTSLLNDGNTSELSTVVNEEVAQKLVLAWQKNAQESGLVEFLAQHGISARLLEKIIRYWPDNAVEKLNENPYRLLVLTTWPTVDKLAAALGLTPNDERRLVAAVEAAVYHNLDVYKDTVTPESGLRKSVKSLLQCFRDDVSGRAIELAVNDGAIVGDAETGYQPYGCMLMERYLADRFASMIDKSKPIQRTLFWEDVKTSDVNSRIREFEEAEGIRLNAEQQSAVHMALTEPLSVLTGGAGVGKTTVLKAVHHALELTDGIVVQMALAGRAAQRMREATGRDAYTIAGFLNQVRLGKIKLSSKHLIVIDESSMLDLMLMYRVVRTLPVGVRLMLVGDPHQLPPIGPGLVFQVLARSTKLRVEELRQVHRQAESTGIPLIAKQVREGEVPELPRFDGPRSGVSFLECAPRCIIGQLVDIVDSLGGFGEVQILGVTKGGPAGVRNINLTFHQRLTSGKRKLVYWGIAESEPVIYTVNDYERELYNGSLGVIEEIRHDPLQPPDDGKEPVRILCDFDGRKVGVPDSELGNVELAYAITTHKAQGSQFRRVIIPITGSKLLDRALIYTALTRGVEQVIFIGERWTFDRAVKAQPKSQGRVVGFSF